MLGSPAHHGCRGRRAAQVAEQPREACCRAGGLLGGQLQRVQTDQHHRTVDEEAHRGHQHEVGQLVRVLEPGLVRILRHLVSRRGRVHPQGHHGSGGQDHEDEARQAALALEHLVRHPAAQQRARNGSQLIDSVGPGRALEVEMLDFGQVNRRPLQHTVADEVDEHVGQRDVPQQAVLQHVGDEDFLGGQILLGRLGVVVVRIVVLPLLDRRQPAGLRRVLHDEEDGNRDDHRRDARVVQRLLPDVLVGGLNPVGVEVDGTGQQHHGARHHAAQVVGRVPDRHHRATLGLGPPVHHGLAARGPAHALEPAVDEDHRKGDGHA